MIRLLDVNVLVALAWPNHLHHGCSHAWFAEIQHEGWATCPLTQSAFVRLSANPAVTDSKVTPAEAAELLRQVCRLDGHSFWDDDVSIATSPHFDWGRIVGHRQVSDAHLLALVIERGGRLATLDTAIHRLVAPAVAAAAIDVVPID